MWGKDYIIIKKVFYILCILSMLLGLWAKMARAQYDPEPAVCGDAGAGEGNGEMEQPEGLETCVDLSTFDVMYFKDADERLAWQYDAMPEATISCAGATACYFDENKWVSGRICGKYYPDAGGLVYFDRAIVTILWNGDVDEYPCQPPAPPGPEPYPPGCEDDPLIECEDEFFRQYGETWDENGDLVEVDITYKRDGGFQSWGDEGLADCIASGECEGIEFATQGEWIPIDQLSEFLDDKFPAGDPDDNGWEPGKSDPTPGGDPDEDPTGDGTGNDGNTAELDYLEDIVSNTQGIMNNQGNIQDNLINLEMQGNIQSGQLNQIIAGQGQGTEDIIDAIEGIPGGGSDMTGVEDGLGDVKGSVDEINDKLETQYEEPGEIGDIEGELGTVAPGIIDEATDEGTLTEFFNGLITDNPVGNYIRGVQVNTSGSCSFDAVLIGRNVTFSLCQWSDELGIMGTILIGLASLQAIMIVTKAG